MTLRCHLFELIDYCCSYIGSQFNNMTLWAQELNATGRAILLENCHQGGLVPGQIIPGQHCSGDSGISDCPYHVYRSSDDIYNHWPNVVNNINSVTPYLSQGADPTIKPRSRPGSWAYPDMSVRVAYTRHTSHT